MQAIEDKVVAVLAEKLSIDEALIQPESLLADELGPDK